MQAEQAPNPFHAIHLQYLKVLALMKDQRQKIKIELKLIERLEISDNKTRKQKSLQLMEGIQLESFQAKRNLCGKIFNDKSVAYVCKDFMLESNSLICEECYMKSYQKYKNYHFISISTNYGGCCDCGDIQKWKEEGCCQDHDPKNWKKFQYNPQDHKLSIHIMKYMFFALFYFYKAYQRFLRTSKVSEKQNMFILKQRIDQMGYYIVMKLLKWNENSGVHNQVTADFLLNKNSTQNTIEQYNAIQENPELRLEYANYIQNIMRLTQLSKTMQEMSKILITLFSVVQFRTELTKLYLKHYKLFPSVASCNLNHLSCQLFTSHKTIEALLTSNINPHDFTLQVNPKLNLNQPNAQQQLEPIAQLYLRLGLDLQYLSRLFNQVNLKYLQFYFNTVNFSEAIDYRSLYNDYVLKAEQNNSTIKLKKQLQKLAIQLIKINKDIRLKIMQAKQEQMEEQDFLDEPKQIRKDIEIRISEIKHQLNKEKHEAVSIYGVQNIFLRRFASIISVFSTQIQKQPSKQSKLKKILLKSLKQLLEYISKYKYSQNLHYYTQERMFAMLTFLYLDGDLSKLQVAQQYISVLQPNLLSNFGHIFKGIAIMLNQKSKILQDNKEINDKYTFYSMIFKQKGLINSLDAIYFKIMVRLARIFKVQYFLSPLFEKQATLLSDCLSKLNQIKKDADIPLFIDDLLFDNSKKMYHLLNYIDLLAELLSSSLGEIIVAAKLKIPYQSKFFTFYDALLQSKGKVSKKVFSSICEQFVQDAELKNYLKKHTEDTLNPLNTTQGINPQYLPSFRFAWQKHLLDYKQKESTTLSAFIQPIQEEVYPENILKLIKQLYDQYKLIFKSECNQKIKSNLKGNFVRFQRLLSKIIKLKPCQQLRELIFQPPLQKQTKKQEKNQQKQQKNINPPKRNKKQQMKKMKQKNSKKLDQFQKSNKQKQISEQTSKNSQQKEIKTCIVCRSNQKQQRLMLMAFVQQAQFSHELKQNQQSSSMHFSTCGHTAHQSCLPKNIYRICQLCSQSSNILIPVMQYDKYTKEEKSVQLERIALHWFHLINHIKQSDGVQQLKSIESIQQSIADFFVVQTCYCAIYLNSYYCRGIIPVLKSFMKLLIVKEDQKQGQIQNINLLNKKVIQFAIKKYAFPKQDEIICGRIEKLLELLQKDDANVNQRIFDSHQLKWEGPIDIFYVRPLENNLKDLSKQHVGKCPHCAKATDLISVCLRCELFKSCRGCKVNSLMQHAKTTHHGQSIFVQVSSGVVFYVGCRQKLWIFESLYQNYKGCSFERGFSDLIADEFILSKTRYLKIKQHIQLLKIQQQIRYQQSTKKRVFTMCI